MPTMDTITHTSNAIGLASDCLVEVVRMMRDFSSSKFGQERDQIILQVGRLQILNDRINNEDITP